MLTESDERYIDSLRNKAKDLEKQVGEYKKQYEIHAEKYLEEVKENRKWKTIIAKLLEEKYLKEGD